MSLCCEISAGASALAISVEGNPPPSLYAAPVVKTLPRKAHMEPVTAEVCTL
ncbi:Hypothetical protein FKW44_020613 [Caligus rogercresseyi]|uniref:Uncharacterized protein n=1 Tax=Caligus rogercresseyi TaxID=217165 RepID=A0A7T8GY24_CALRO|nr:Hypothetical protein FKW44_020613 [Caligus rogercresseyi]